MKLHSNTQCYFVINITCVTVVFVGCCGCCGYCSFMTIVVLIAEVVFNHFFFAGVYGEGFFWYDITNSIVSNNSYRGIVQNVTGAPIVAVHAVVASTVVSFGVGVGVECHIKNCYCFSAFLFLPLTFFLSALPLSFFLSLPLCLCLFSSCSLLLHSFPFLSRSGATQAVHSSLPWPTPLMSISCQSTLALSTQVLTNTSVNNGNSTSNSDNDNSNHNDSTNNYV